MRFENGHVVTDFRKRARTDQSLKGIQKMYKETPEEAICRADEIVNRKMTQNEEKYLVEKVKGNAAKYDQL